MLFKKAFYLKHIILMPNFRFIRVSKHGFRTLPLFSIEGGPKDFHPPIKANLHVLRRTLLNYNFASQRGRD